MAQWIFFVLLFCSALPPSTPACTYCSQPTNPDWPTLPKPKTTHPPHHKKHYSPPFAGGGVPALNPPGPGQCTLDVLKLGLCLDLLGGLVHVGLDPVENYCCPVLEGLLELEAAVCLCTAIKLKVLNLNIYIPLALNVLITCGKEPPPGYVCPLN